MPRSRPEPAVRRGGALTVDRTGRLPRAARDAGIRPRGPRPLVVIDALTVPLATWPAQDVVVTAELGDPIRRTAFSDRVWRPAVRPAGLSGMALCWLRHLCASLLIGHGESVES
jgi:hypothetical protein